MLASNRRQQRSRVLLATAWVTVRVPSGRFINVRALLDQGSEITFLSENVAQLLRATRLRMPISVAAVGGVDAGTHRHATEISVSPRDALSPAFKTVAVILPKLTSYVPPRVSFNSALAHLSDLTWADGDPASSHPIELIIGADLYSDLVLEGVRRGAIGEPIAQRTVLGWVVSGPVREPRLTSPGVASFACARDSSLPFNVHHCSTSSLEQEIRRFWEIEEIPHSIPLAPHDEACEEHFRLTHSRGKDGRYVVRLPFKAEPPIDIGDSRVRAEQSFRQLIRKLQSQRSLEREYSQFLDEYHALGHMRLVRPVPDPTVQRVYLPHHAVIKETSTSTRLRVVFNASSRTTNGSSLNDHLYVGPKLQADITAVLSRWRLHRYVYSADIEKMYRQIRLDSRDVDYQRIFWRDASSYRAAEFQLLTVTYGMACAPFLALRVLQQLAKDEGDVYPLAVPVMRSHIYIDDVLFGADDLSQLERMREQVVALLRRGGFELRKWCSNSPSLLTGLDDAQLPLEGAKLIDHAENIRILGISWNPSRDAFQFIVTTDPVPPHTKRKILSAIARLYDPLGWVTPVTIAAKIFMQQLWRLQVGWDEDIAEPLLSRWTALYNQLPSLNGFTIPRHVGLRADSRRVELHGFSNASNVAYAAVVYLRVVSSAGDVQVTLMAGKSRVAPVKTLSVPRLELSAAVLLARLVQFVGSLLPGAPPCHCWTDSTIVLAWVTQSPSRWRTFVANRVAKIQSVLPAVAWHHVPTADNPADCASRGLLGSDLLSHDLWLHGPGWLLQPAESWPTSDSPLPSDAPLEERTVSLHCSAPPEGWDLATRYSSWCKLIRVTAYTLRFVNLCRKRLQKPHAEATGLALSAAECQAAKLFWYRTIQAELFPDALRLLSRGQHLGPKGSLSALRPSLDEAGVMRVGGRLENAPLPFSCRHPVILAAHPVVTLIVTQAHLRALHAGTQLTLSILRRDFWILRARDLVKSVIHKCLPCIRERAEVPTQLMGNLPPRRISRPPRTFSHCGLDYAGPVRLRSASGRGAKSHKAYIALIVCLATKAVHLELVSDYSTPAFRNAFTRFCARRGLPQTMYSDNGTNFVGADRELTTAYRRALQDPDFLNSTSADHVTWNFIPPGAPHFGGLWEAGVRSVKFHLRRVVGDHTLTFEEFSTLLCQIEACLNSRPIAPLTDSVDDYECLTPGHFLVGAAITGNPEPSLLSLNENRLSRWQLIRRITEQFWRLWQNDYVNTLQQRQKWRTDQPSLRVGQLILLRNPNLPPCKWEIGRVTQCHAGSDGLVRVVSVKTASTEYRRPIVKLCALPIYEAETSEASSFNDDDSRPGE